MPRKKQKEGDAAPQDHHVNAAATPEATPEATPPPTAEGGGLPNLGKPNLAVQVQPPVTTEAFEALRAKAERQEAALKRIDKEALEKAETNAKTQRGRLKTVLWAIERAKDGGEDAQKELGMADDGPDELDEASGALYQALDALNDAEEAVQDALAALDADEDDEE